MSYVPDPVPNEPLGRRIENFVDGRPGAYRPTSPLLTREVVETQKWSPRGLRLYVVKVVVFRYGETIRIVGGRPRRSVPGGWGSCLHTKEVPVLFQGSVSTASVSTIPDSLSPLFRGTPRLRPTRRGDVFLRRTEGKERIEKTKKRRKDFIGDKL